MALQTALTKMLNIEHPIMLAGMGGVSYAEVCAAMCNAGGYGVLGMAGTTPDFIEGQMKRVRELTDRPFGVDLLAASPESLKKASMSSSTMVRTASSQDLACPCQSWSGLRKPM